jgi:hypothetical protein
MSMKSLVLSIVFALILPGFIVLATQRPSFDLPGFVFGLLILGPICAAFFGHAAHRQFRKEGNAGTIPRSLAVAGISAGYAELAFVTFGLLTTGHRPYPYEAVAVGSLRSINFAMHSYAEAHPTEGFPTSLMKLRFDAQQPANDWSLDQALASGTKSHYRFTYIPTRERGIGIIDRYRIFADPLDAKDKDLRHFFTDQSEIIRMSRGAPADESSTALQ